MSSITIKMKDCSVRDFPHEGRPGGSYTKTITYKDGFAIVEDEYHIKTAIPACDIAEVVERPERSW